MTADVPRPPSASRRQTRLQRKRHRRRLAAVYAVITVVAVIAGVLGWGASYGRWFVHPTGAVPSATAPAVTDGSGTTGASASAREMLPNAALSRSAVPAVSPAVLARQRLDTLHTGLTAQISAYPGTWQVYVEDGATGVSMVVNDRPMYSASVIKLFVMAAVFQQMADGALDDTANVNTLLEQMITVSSNEATNSLIRLLGNGNGEQGFALINRFAGEHGYASTHLSQWLGVLDGNAQAKQTSASDAGRLLSELYRGRLVSPAASRSMLSLLLHQTRREKIPAGLPAGTPVANKTGEAGGIEHDAAIVFGSGQADLAPDAAEGQGRTGDYVLVVMGDEVPDVQRAQRAIREISATVWSAMEH